VRELVPELVRVGLDAGLQAAALGHLVDDAGVIGPRPRMPSHSRGERADLGKDQHVL
jgi:hypothetical protein